MPSGSRNSSSGPVISRKDAATSCLGRKRARKSRAVSAGAGSLNLLISRQARADLHEGARYYDAEDKTSNVSARFLNAVGAAFDTVAEAPQPWPRVQGLPPNRSMQYYVMLKFPYTVVYQRRAEDIVEIVAVAHHKRQSKYGLVDADADGPDAEGVPCPQPAPTLPQLAPTLTQLVGRDLTQVECSNNKLIRLTDVAGTAGAGVFLKAEDFVGGDTHNFGGPGDEVAVDAVGAALVV